MAQTSTTPAATMNADARPAACEVLFATSPKIRLNRPLSVMELALFCGLAFCPAITYLLSLEASAARRSLPGPARPRMASACGLAVDALAQRDGVELGVGGLFLVQVRGQEPDDVIMAEFVGPCDQRAIGGDLVVLDRLPLGHDRGIEHGLVLDLARGCIGFLDQAVDRRAVGAGGL